MMSQLVVQNGITTIAEPGFPSPSFDTENIKFLPKQIKLFANGAIYSQLMQMQEGYTDGRHGEWMTPLDMYTAMQAITINAARTLNPENEIGSIEEGKVANFTLLEKNPFKIDLAKLKDIKVLGTVYRGRQTLVD